MIVCSTVLRLVSGQDAAQIPRSHRAIFRKLLASGKPLVWIAFGSPYVLSTAPQVGTCICAFSHSDVSQIAAAKALTGEIAVTGKTPVSIPGLARAGDGLEIPKLEMVLKEAAPGTTDSPAYAFEKTTQLLDSLVEEQVFQRAEFLVGYKGVIALKHSASVTGNAVHDLASLSSIAAAVGAMLAAESGSLIPEAPVQDYLPELKGNDSRLRVQELLTSLSDRTKAEEAESTSRHELVMEIVSRASGLPFQRFLDTRLFEPMGMKCTLARPPESARADAGAAAENRSLFCSAHDLAVLAQVLLNRGIYDHRRYFKSETISRFAGGQGPWSKPSGTDWTGRWLSPSAFGYNSATGSTFWVDPDRQLFVVLLTAAPPSSGGDERIPQAVTELLSSVMYELTAYN
jgi:CubicO group peptidase (beta-lactamase class C family)